MKNLPVEWFQTKAELNAAILVISWILDNPLVKSDIIKKFQEIVEKKHGWRTE